VEIVSDLGYLSVANRLRPMVISMLAIGGLFFVLFLIVEWKVSELPMMPSTQYAASMISTNWHQCICSRMLPYPPLLSRTSSSGLYFMAIFTTCRCIVRQAYHLVCLGSCCIDQNVREFPVIKSAYLTIRLIVTQSMASICSGQYISRCKRYGECIWLGFTLLTVGTALTTLFGRTTLIYGNVLKLVMLGIGNGNVFQPTIISLQAHSPKAQRAIVISIRNFIRCLVGRLDWQ
jgi:hypothetical protein